MTIVSAPAAKREGGFTLVELLVATGIVSVVMLAAYRGFSAGLISWQRAGDSLNALAQARAFVGTLSRELRCAVLLDSPEDGTAFSATSESLAFCTTATLGDGAAKAASAVTRVAYEFDAPAPVGRGRATVRRSRQFMSGSRPITEKAGGEVLSGDIEVELQYLAAGSSGASSAWQSEWRSKEQLPRAVQIGVVVGSSPPGRNERRQMRLSTTVHIVAHPLQQ